jgi:hypothetical protein
MPRLLPQKKRDGVPKTLTPEKEKAMTTAFDDLEVVRPKTPIASEGLVRGAAVDFIDDGMKMNPRYNKMEPKGRLVFEIDERVPDKDYNFTVQVRFTISFHKKAYLTKLLRSWGVPVPAEGERFKFATLRNRPAQLLIRHSEPDRDGRVYANIESIMADKSKNPYIPKGTYKRWIPQEQRTQRPEYNDRADNEPPTDEDEIPF